MTSHHRRSSKQLCVTRDYNIWHTPCLAEPLVREQKSVSTQSLVDAVTSQQIRFDEFSVEVVRQLLEERQLLRDENRRGIMEEITEVSGKVSCWDNLRYAPDASREKSRLEKTKTDLEDKLRKEDLMLWKDVALLRRDLIEAERKCEATKLRAGLISRSEDEHKEEQDPVGTGDVPRVEAFARRTG